MREITRSQMFYILGIEDGISQQHIAVQKTIDDMHDDGLRYIDIAREMYLDMRQDYMETVRGKKQVIS